MAIDVEVDSGSFTPESLKLRRRLAEAMMKQGMDASPIGSPWQGLARIAQAMIGGWQLGELERKEKGQQEASDQALLSLLGPAVGGTSETVAPTYSPGPQTTGQVDAAVAPFASAIAGIETPGESDPYRAKGPVVQSGDRAYGKYQVMGTNVGPWTKELLGREMTPEEFLNDPQAQEKVFAGKFGQYLEKTGNPQDAASMWFTGRPAAQGANRQARDADGNPLGITGQQYVEKFSAGLTQGGPQPSVTGGSAGTQPMTVENLPPQMTPMVRQRIGAMLNSRDPRVQELARRWIYTQVMPKAPMTPEERLKLEKTQAETEKLRSDVKKAEFDTAAKGKEVSDAAIEDRYKLQDAIGGIDDSWRATSDLINHPGLPEIAGLPLGGEVGVPVAGVELTIADLKPGTTQADAFNAHKSLVSQVALRTMDRLKQQSATGATGFGALSEKELKILENSIGNLRLSSSKEELVKNYKKFQDDLMEMRDRLIDRFERKYGKDVKTGVPSKTDLFNSASESAIELAQRPYARPQAIPLPFTGTGIPLPFTSTTEPWNKPEAPQADPLAEMVTQTILPKPRTLQEVMRARKGDMLPFSGGGF